MLLLLMQQFHALFWIKLIFHTTGAHLLRQIRLPRQQQTLLEDPLKNIYSIDPIAISIKIGCVQISTLQNKFLSSHSCAIIFQQIPMVSPLGLNRPHAVHTGRTRDGRGEEGGGGGGQHRNS